MKVYVTKYALTKGILEVAGFIDERFKCFFRSQDGRMDSLRGNEWSLYRPNALKRAEDMRIRKISSLENQLQKLKEMRFE